jgi:hypothetical protein
MTPTQPTFTGKIEILPDGTVKMYTNPTAPGAVPGDYKIYQRKGRKDWLLMSYKHQVALERLGVAWMEETFGASYEQKVCRYLAFSCATLRFKATPPRPLIRTPCSASRRVAEPSRT